MNLFFIRQHSPSPDSGGHCVFLGHYIFTIALQELDGKALARTPTVVK